MSRGSMPGAGKRDITDLARISDVAFSSPINAKGELVIPARFEEVPHGGFVAGLARVRFPPAAAAKAGEAAAPDEGRQGYVDVKGKPVWIEPPDLVGESDG